MNFKDLESKQKLRGGYYTPYPIAELLSSWVLSGDVHTILEPSCGDGCFLQAIYNQVVATNRSRELSIEAVEIVPEEAAKAELVSRKLRDSGMKVLVINHDIFKWLCNGKAGKLWDAIVGNPPYIRYQYFEKEQRETSAIIFDKANVPFSKRTNAWVPLLIASVMHLAPGGRLAMVVPAELMHIQHASGLRQLLEQEMETLTIINIRDMVFPGILQGVVLLLGIKRNDRDFKPLYQESRLQPSLLFQEDNKHAEIHILDVDSVDDLSRIALAGSSTFIPKKIDDTAGEWMFGLLTDEEAALIKRLRERKGIYRFDAIASVDIGIVTGANNFFVVNEETLKKYRLEDIAAPMLAKSELIKGIIYTSRDHETNAKAGKSVYLLSFPEKPIHALPPHMAEYLRLGERNRLYERYKCRIRDPWYVVPYIWASEVSLLKRCHLYPRLVVNELSAYSTDTAYRIELSSAYTGRAKDLAFSFLNSLTFLYAELEGRHYGGGVLELVPSEIEKLLIPLRSVAESDFIKVDTMIRNNATLDEIVEYTDKIILNEGLALSLAETQILRNAHRRLLKRRLRA